MKTLNHKVEYLTKLMETFLLFSKKWRDVSVSLIGDIVTVQWFNAKNAGGPDVIVFDEKEVPVHDLDNFIDRCKNKLRYEFKKRNNGK